LNQVIDESWTQDGHSPRCTADLLHLSTADIDLALGESAAADGKSESLP
jgi:hypothetical protein